MSLPELRPLRTEDDYDRSLAEIDQVLHAEPGTPEGDRLEILSALVHEYERKHHPIADPTPRAMVEFLLDQGRISREELREIAAA